MDFSSPKDWIVRVYDRDSKLISKWEILNRTEREADREADAEVLKIYGADDWTMMEKENET